MAYNKETGMYEGFIYLLENNINNNKYVGQTNRTIEKRFKEHIRDCDKFDYAIYNALNKHGYENFSITELEKCVCDNKKNLSKLLDEREIYWVAYYDTYYNGYNETIGGQNNPPNRFPDRPVIEYTIHGDFISRYDSARSASDATGFSRSDISSCCLRTKVHRVQNRIFRFEDSPLTDEEKLFYINKYPTIVQFDFEGNIINKFEFVAQAKEYLKDNGCEYAAGSNISDACAGHIKFAYGYVWRYNNDPFDKYELPIQIIVEQRNLITGELINTFNSYKEAAIATGSDDSCINMCCLGKQQYHNGYIWCLQGNFNKNIKIKLKEKSVAQYTAYGELIRYFNSIKEASEITSINHCSINDVCHGRHMFAGGFVWRFKDDNFTKYDVDIDKYHMHLKRLHNN